MTKPKICVMSLENDENLEEIVVKIQKQNPKLSNSELKIIKSFRNKNRWRNLNIVMEVDSESFKKIIEMDVVKVG